MDHEPSHEGAAPSSLLGRENRIGVIAVASADGRIAA